MLFDSLIVVAFPELPDYSFIPKANAGADQTVRTISTVQLDGTASICNFYGDILPIGGISYPNPPAVMPAYPMQH